MRAKLVLPVSKQEKLETSAYFNRVNFVVGESIKVGDELHTVLEYKDVQDLANMFLKADSFTGKEKAEHLAILKKKADAKAEAEKKAAAGKK